jgi:hypothetical protein
MCLQHSDSQTVVHIHVSSTVSSQAVYICMCFHQSVVKQYYIYICLQQSVQLNSSTYTCVFNSQYSQTLVHIHVSKIKLDHQIWTGLIKFRDYFNIYSYESNLTVDIGLELFTIEDTCICTNVWLYWLTNYNIPNHPLPGIKGFHFASLFHRLVKKRCKGKTNKKQNREFYIVKGQTNKKQNRQWNVSMLSKWQIQQGFIFRSSKTGK